jgi:hypothetical protein
LILSTLDEIYSQFKSDCPEVKIGFSEFCKLGLKHCILAVCVCAIHQNVKLMATGIKLKDPTSDMNLELDISTHSHCLALMIYNPPTEECFFNGCAACPGEGIV